MSDKTNTSLVGRVLEEIKKEKEDKKKCSLPSKKGIQRLKPLSKPLQ